MGLHSNFLLLVDFDEFALRPSNFCRNGAAAVLLRRKAKSNQNHDLGEFFGFFYSDLFGCNFLSSEPILDSSSVFRTYSARSVDCAWFWKVTVKVKDTIREGASKRGEIMKNIRFFKF